MDQVTIIASAVALATTVGTFVSLFQERFFGRVFEGSAALIFNTFLSLLVGGVAVLQNGGFVVTFTAHDPIATAASVLANALILLAASQAAFRILTRPVARA